MEYQALLAGMKDALDRGVWIYVYMDSLLVINQVRGIWKIKNVDPNATIRRYENFNTTV